MQTLVRGYALFYQGTFNDRKEKDEHGKPVKIAYSQLGVLERTPDGLNLVKVSVPKEKIDEAMKFDGANVEVIADAKETNYDGKAGLKFTFLQAKKAA